MRVLALIFSFFLTACGLDMANDNANTRIVSTSLCGDTYVLDAVAHNNIAALSWQSGDDISMAPDTFKDKPKASDNAEVLLALNPTLVVFGPGEGALAKPLLDRSKIAYVSLEWGEDFDSISRNKALLLKAAQLEPARLNSVQPLPRRAHPRVLYITSSGATAGPGTYVDAAIETAGGKNIITTQGWHTPNIENLVALNPDLIVTSFFKDGYASVNDTGLRNKVLRGKMKEVPMVNVPGKLWPCAGPGLLEATKIIRDALLELNQ